MNAFEIIVALTLLLVVWFVFFSGAREERKAYSWENEGDKEPIDHEKLEAAESALEELPQEELITVLIQDNASSYGQGQINEVIQTLEENGIKTTYNSYGNVFAQQTAHLKVKVSDVDEAKRLINELLKDH